MSEELLREGGREPQPGMRFGFGENLPDGMWAAVITEIERRGEQWIVTRLDRKKESLPESEVGLRELSAAQP